MSADALRIEHLVRGAEPLQRGAEASRRLLRVVQEWGPQSSLTLTVGGSPTVAEASVAGRPEPGWADDVRWALGGVARLVPASRTSVSTPPVVSEVAPVQGAARADQAHWAHRAHWADWPVPLFADLGRLLALDADADADADADDRARLGLQVRYRLAGVSALETSMLREELDETWDPGRGPGRHYLETPTRLRVLIGSSVPLPARVRAVLRDWGTDLGLEQLDDARAAEAWCGDPVGLAGYARPFGVGLALLRLPVASASAFPGIPSAEPAVVSRPLDPVPPRPQAGAVCLGRARSADGSLVDVLTSLDDLTQHGFVQGASGSGKSTFLASLVLALHDAGASVTLLDPEGSTAATVVRHSSPRDADRIRLIRHGDPAFDVPLNILDAEPADRERMVDLFTEMIQQAQDPHSQGMVGPRWRRWFTLIAQAAALHLGPDATLVSVAAIASDMGRVRALADAVRSRDPDLAHRLHNEYGRLKGDEADGLVSWGISKLGPMLSGEQTRWIFGAGPDGVDVRAAMDAGQSLLVDLGAHRLGEPAGQAIGATYLLKHWAALSRRTNRDQRHFVIVDEAHLFAYGPLPKLLAEARKFGVGVIVATQHIGQLTTQLADALESNTGLFVSLRAGLQSGARASSRLDGWPVTELVRLPTFTAAASLTRDGLALPPFTLLVERYDELGGRAAGGSERADDDSVARRIRASSSALAGDGRAALRPISDQELMGTLSRSRPAAAPGQSSFLDEWWESRQARAASSTDG